MHFVYICAVFALSAVNVAELQKTPTIQVQSGKLRGLVTPDGFRGYFHSYLGIPYAKVEKRFQAAKPVNKWSGVLEANDSSVRCSQVNFPALFLMQDSTETTNQEDCLRLNVFTPLPQADAGLKPVIVFIHGGGFWIGSSSPRTYGADYLVRNDVIVVSLNYRLDVLGFLCLGTKEAPGNMGMKDQVLALKWVKNNIEAFGGDPNSITILGESAGGASVMYHLISPMSKGLFNKAIMQSGSVAAPWSFQFEPLNITKQLASLMGYNTEDSNELYKIFMNKTSEELLSYRVPRPIGDIILGTTVFVPCVEQEIPGIEPFITDVPYNYIARGEYTKLPMIIGYNDNEGYIFAGNEDADSLANITFYDSLPRDLLFPTTDERQKTADKLQELYMGDKEISVDNMLELSRYEGDSQIIASVISTADLITKSNDQDTFLYKFAYDGQLNLQKYVCGFGAFPGSTHMDEMQYLFMNTLSGASALKESDMINKMTTMWTNFAKFDNPTPQATPLLPTLWLPASKENTSVFVIGNQVSTAPLWENDKLLFWNETYSLYRRTK